MGNCVTRMCELFLFYIQTTTSVTLPMQSVTNDQFVLMIVTLNTNLTNNLTNNKDIYH